MDVAEALESVLKITLSLSDTGKICPIILIDGRSGSGKTWFARELQNELFKQGESAPRVVHMDDLYDGWSGLQAGHDYLLRYVLNPVKNSKTASWQEFDWGQMQRTGRWREFEATTPLIVEGCGALSEATAALADIKIWLQAEADLRKQRWDSREPAEHEPFWPIWAAQEEEFYAREKSESLADFKVLSS